MVIVWTALVTGLFAGGASCAAVQGGLVAGMAARRATPTQQSRGHTAPALAATSSRSAGTDALTVALFLLGKLAAYAVLGFGLGWLGQAVQLTPRVQAMMLITAGIIMLVMALDLFGVVAAQRLVPTPPTSWTRLVRREAKGTGQLAPVALGASTVLLPCGVTISMEVAAIATGSPLLGAAVMAAFVIGTAPLFFLLGFAAHRLVGSWGGRLAAITAGAVLVAGLLSINSGLNLAGSPITLASVTGLGQEKVSGVATASTGGGEQIVIQASARAYSPNAITASPGPIQLVVRSVGANGCIRSFTIPSLGINEILPSDGETAISLGTLPAGRYPFSCGMGMYTGTITVTA